MDTIIRRATEDDFRTVFDFYSKGIYENRGRPPTIKDESWVSENIQDFYVALCNGKIVSQMAITFPFEIKYISLDGKLIEDTDAFLHDMYTPTEHRRRDLISRIWEIIESEAKENQEIQYLYSVPENPGILQAMEKRGYKRVGKECKSCASSENECSNVPMYRKKNE